MSTDAEELATAVTRLVGGVQHWTPPRWRAASSVSGRTRADEMHALVQRLADLAAEAEGEPARTVPRLDNDLALPDQLLTVTRDLVRHGNAAHFDAAMRDIARTRTALWGDG